MPFLLVSALKLMHAWVGRALLLILIQVIKDTEEQKILMIYPADYSVSTQSLLTE